MRTRFAGLSLLLALGLVLVAVVPAFGARDRSWVAFPMYATGEIGCDGAEERSNRVGRAVLRPVEDGVRYNIVLRNVAPDWDYYLELQVETADCQHVAAFVDGFTSNRRGKLRLRGVFDLPPGVYRVNVDVVSDPSDNVPPDSRHREIGGYGYVEIVVPGGTGTTTSLPSTTTTFPTTTTWPLPTTTTSPTTTTWPLPTTTTTP